MLEAAKTNWWGRNWKWFVPVVAVLTGVVLFAGSIAGLLYFIFGLMKSSDAYKEALSRAQASPAVIAALGTPIEAGHFVTGNININGPSGHAELAIPISGPKGNATLYLEAHKSAGEWSFSRLVVETSIRRIDLLHETTAPLAPYPAPDGIAL